MKVYRALGGRRTTSKAGITWHGMRVSSISLLLIKLGTYI